MSLPIETKMVFLPFPSIGQFRTTVSNVNKFCSAEHHDVPPTITFHGTVKLHGTNAAVGFANGSMWVQSRNRIITPQSDNAGFAGFVQSHEDVFRSLATQLPPSPTGWVIFGEWCGGNIQNSNNLALKLLPKMFVIFAVREVGEPVEEKKDDEDDQNVRWLPREEFEHLKSPENLIFNIYQFPTWEVEIDFASTADAQNKLVEITMAVEKECPAGRHFGVFGIGEGVVWRGEFENQRLCFKVKGDEHSASKVRTLGLANVEKLASATAFVDYAVTENRLNQGIEYVFTQNGKEVSMKGMGDFLKWITADVLKEETDTMTASGLVFKDVIGLIGRKAGVWFKTYTK